MFQQTVRNRLAQLASQTRGVDLSDDAALDVFDQGSWQFSSELEASVRFLNPSFARASTTCIDHLVAFAEGVMKRDRHPVLESRALDRLLERAAQLPVQLASGSAR